MRSGTFGYVVLVAGLLLAARVSAAEAKLSLVIVIDGLRPDYITREVMPRLHALGEEGVIAEAHHAVFPTVTRVNSASIASGTYPRVHGLMHNTIYLPEASANPIDSGDAAALLRVEVATGGKLLTAPTLGELFAAAGHKVLGVGSGTTGSLLLLNHKASESSALFGSRDLIRPESWRGRAEAILGPMPAMAYPNRAATRWAVDAYLGLGLKEFNPDVTFMWITDPDHTAHRHGMGSEKAIEALRNADEELGRILDSITRRGLRERVNIFVTADHGFSTHGGPFNVSALLTARGLGAGVKVVGGNQVYLAESPEKPEKLKRIVALLQETEWVGALFTRARAVGSHEGVVPGTLSFDAIHYQHARAPDLLVDPNWSDAVNAHGYAGATTAGGVAGHGSSSPFDITIRLTAAGPNIKRATRSRVPTGNIDLAVTLCHLHGVKPAATMAGRVMSELLREGPPSESVRVNRDVRRVSAEISGGRYEVELQTSRVGKTEYVDFTRTVRASR